jgi:signal transduction histidine kinase
MKLYFKRGVMSGFIITLLVVSCMGIYAFVSIRKLIEASIVQSRNLLITTNAEKVSATKVDLETGQRGYVITGDSGYLEPYDKTLVSIGKEIDNVRLNIDVRNLPNATDDNGMMSQVWYRLISNALKYSGNTENPAVEIGSFLRHSDVCYYVEDNGVGFNIPYAHKLHGRSRRLHKQDEFEGTGVGLTLIKRIINRHKRNV